MPFLITLRAARGGVTHQIHDDLPRIKKDASGTKRINHGPAVLGCAELGPDDQGLSVDVLARIYWKDPA